MGQIAPRSASVVLSAAVVLVLGVLIAPTAAHAQCAGTSVSLVVTPVTTTCPGTKTATASWTVTSGAGVQLDFVLNGTSNQVVQLGNNGAWTFTSPVAPGTHTLTVIAAPLVASGGGYLVCSAQGVSNTQTFSFTCPLGVALGPCSWNPAAPVLPGTTSTGNCIANLSGGTPPYNLTWTSTGGPTRTQTGSAPTWASPTLTCVAPGTVDLMVADSVGQTMSVSAPCP